MTYAFEVLGYGKNSPCGLEDVRNAIPLIVANVDVAVVEGSKHLFPRL